MKDPVVIGRIGAASGVKGWVKLQSFTQPQENFFALNPRFIKRRGDWQPLVIEDLKVQSKGFIAKLEGIEDREAAKLLANSEIAVEGDVLPELEGDEFYWHQLEGMRVVSQQGEDFGVVDHILETGANDVLVVRAGAESIDDRERLIPWIDGVVEEVSREEKIIRVQWDKDF